MARSRIIPANDPSVNGRNRTPEPDVEPETDATPANDELFPEESDPNFDPAELEQSLAEPAATLPQLAGLDSFDPESLRLDSAVTTGVQPLLLSVQVRKPGKSEFVRAHPDPAYRLQTGVIELKEERGELYLVAPELRAAVGAEPVYKPKLFVTAITRQGVLFLWPLSLPGSTGRTDEWTRTALEAVQIAQTSWIRITANMASGAYDVVQAVGQLGDPVWPARPFKEILRIAFREKYIDNANHAVLRRLRGEV